MRLRLTRPIGILAHCQIAKLFSVSSLFAFLSNRLIVMQTFHLGNFTSLCDELGRKDRALNSVIHTYGYPPMWTRPGNFSTLIHIILEQQVSLASAKAAFVKLKKRLGGITPKSLLLLSDEELRACYFSRQKSGYARHLAEMKKMFWKGTEHWDKLLLERAATSGKLILSEFSRNAINKNN